MKTITVKQRIFWGYAAVFVMVLITAVFSLIWLNDIRRDAKFVANDSIHGFEYASVLRSNANEAQLDTVNLVFETDPAKVKVYEENLLKYEEVEDEYMEKFQVYLEEPELAQMYNKLKPALLEYEKDSEYVLGLVMKGDKESAVAFLPELRASFEYYQSLLKDIFEWELQMADDEAWAVVHLANRNTVLTILLTVIALAVEIFFAAKTNISLRQVLGEITLSMREGISKIMNAAQEVSVSTQILAEGSSEQAASVEETSASLAEMASMVESNANSTNSAKEETHMAHTEAEAGAQSTAKMNASMQSIKAAGEEMRQAMQQVQTASSDIAKIIDTINEIAFQTNLLALNAAVEAARAGEAGAGFAVVADEVRNLAGRSAKAAAETDSMIKSAIDSSESAVMTNQKVLEAVEEVAVHAESVSNALAGIVKKVQTVDDEVSHIAQASSEQSLGINEISKAISQVEEVIQRNAATAEESAGVTEELKGQAKSFQDEIVSFERKIG